MPERDELLASNYDGIQEYDNDLPRWWIYLFWVTILFAVFYVGYLHFGPGLDQHQRLALEMKELENKRAELEQAKPKRPSGEEHLADLLSDQNVLALGKKVYSEKCVACHLAQGQGLVGPNLTDDNWLHGGTLTDIREIIITGVPAKGMLPWKGIISDEEIDAVTVYIRTLRGTNPPNPKEAQGALVRYE